MKLYELSNSYIQLLEIAEDLDATTLEDTLSSINEEFEDKVENTAKVIRQLEAQVETIRNEARRLDNRARAMEKNAKRLKEYLQEELERTGKTKVKGSLFTIGVQNNPPSVRLAEDFNNQTYLSNVVVKYDKRAILEDLKQGKEVTGAKIIQEKSLRIR